MPMPRLVFPAVKHFRMLQEFLRQRSAGGHEAAAILLCGAHRATGRYLVRSIILPEEECFEYRGPDGVRLRSSFDREVLSRARQEGLSLVQCHTHPFAGDAHFSPADDEFERSRAEVLAAAFKMPLLSMVFDRTVSTWQARVWKKSGEELLPEPLTVQQNPLVFDLSRKVRVNQALFDRQVLAFGSPLQERLGQLVVGVVGCGGLGMLVVEGLARLGVLHFILVDPDHVEFSNLNRLAGATLSDARQRVLKVELGARLVASIAGRRAVCRTNATRLPDRTVSRQLARCDVLVAATDDHGGRLEVMSIGASFMRPVVNCGVHLEAEGGSIKRILARVAAIRPRSGGCLYCTGQIDPVQAARETADEELRSVMHQRGYLPDTPQPAVWWVNASAASLAVRAIHGMVYPFGATDDDTYQDIVLDHLTGEQLHLVHQERPDCPVCGAQGCSGLGDAFFNVPRLSKLDLR